MERLLVMEGAGDMDKEILAQIESVADADSFFPERRRKSRKQRMEELLEWYKKYGEIHYYYNMYGSDIEGAEEPDSWLDSGIFRKHRHDVNANFYPSGSLFPIDYTTIMRDKLLFEMFASRIVGNRCVKSIAYMEGRQFFMDMENGACGGVLQKRNFSLGMKDGNS